MGQMDPTKPGTGLGRWSAAEERADRERIEKLHSPEAKAESRRAQRAAERASEGEVVEPIQKGGKKIPGTK